MARKSGGGKLMRAALQYLKKANQRGERHGRMRPWARDHVFKGHIKPGAPTGSGFHYRPGGQDWPGRRIKTSTVTRDPDTGLYQAEVEYFDRSVPPDGAWRPKSGHGGVSTFFPDHWSPSEVDNAVNTAFHRSSPVPGTDRWRGDYRGITIEGFYHQGGVGHGWPVF
ncbi:EndoU nuclease-like protein [Asanoa ferruginea]|uniref:EndoU nuclease-like protein n=2 Tax=Asanoa ferruginea TaxID=53367 RepID=A0A3D9ZE84_9ACTN|nr:EndoU nuclease-like protein [Asanoa ferruginea]GIF45598.1 hypothetical protein Afe04nite_01370 [Asanoa ferruginea]